MHEQPDDHTEDDSPHGAGHTDIRPQDACGEDDGQHIDRRTGVEKSDGRSQAGAALPDAGKQRQHRTGTDGQDRAGNAGHPVGEHLAGAGARYFITAPWETKTATPPAMKNAGTKQSRTCSWAYHLARARDSITAWLKRALSTGRKKKSRKPPTIMASGFQTACQSMRLGASDSVAGVPAAFCAGPSEITSLIWHPPGLVRDHQGILIPQARTKLSYIVIYSYMKAKKKTQFLFRISKRSILSIPSSNPETSGSSFNQWRRLPKMDAAKGLWRPSARV